MLSVILIRPGSTDFDAQGRIQGTLDDDLRLLASSPAIDAGHNPSLTGVALDMNGYPRFLDERMTPDAGIGPGPIVDMGAYEFSFGLGDLNCDGDINALDIEPFIDLLFP